jgi:hypothetical protein
MTAEKDVYFQGIATIDVLRGSTIALLTTTEIIILDCVEWRILLRQKHRRDLDPSLIMKVFSAEEGTQSLC